MTILTVLENAAENVESEKTIDRMIGTAQIKAAVRLLKEGHKPQDSIYEIVEKEPEQKQK